MARLSDTSIVNTNGQSDDVVVGWNIEIDVVQYDSPFIVRLLRLQYKHSVFSCLNAACYRSWMKTYGNDISVILEYEAAFNYRLPSHLDLYYNSIEVTPVYTLPLKQDFFHKIVNGECARFGFDLILKGSTTVPYVHKYPGGSSVALYDFCANNYGRDAVIRYVDDEYIPYVTSCKYKLGVEENRDGNTVFRLTPLKRLDL